MKFRLADYETDETILEGDKTTLDKSTFALLYYIAMQRRGYKTHQYWECISLRLLVKRDKK